MITYREVDSSYFEMYDKIPMLVPVKSILAIEKIENGLGGILFKELPVTEHSKDLGKIDEYAYWHDNQVKEEVQLIWYLDLEK